MQCAICDIRTHTTESCPNKDQFPEFMEANASIFLHQIEVIDSIQILLGVEIKDIKEVKGNFKDFNNLGENQ